MNDHRDKTTILIRISCMLAFFANWGATVCGQTNRMTVDFHSIPTNHQTLEQTMFTTHAYAAAALDLMIQEANQVAGALTLDETLPIRRTNLISKFVIPYGMTKFMTEIGNITTSNYNYVIGMHDKLCFVTWNHEEQALRSWAKSYSWPMSRLDTNAAVELATQWLAAASMDVAGLSRDCNVHVLTVKIAGNGTNAYFIPAYTVVWAKGPRGHGSTASVRVFVPTKSLMYLYVDDPEYNLRKPVLFTNLDALLSGS